MNNNRIFKVLIVDDSKLYRKILSNILSEIPNVSVVGFAENGKIALTKFEELKPDIVTLDIEMPEMDGLETLRLLKIKMPKIPVIMVSSLTMAAARITIKALELGAFDFVTKPNNLAIEESRKSLIYQLKPKINALITKQIVGSILTGNSAGKYVHKQQEIYPTISSKVIAFDKSKIDKSVSIQIVVIGISTGGPNALMKLLPSFPQNLEIPIIIVQHMPQFFTAPLVESLNAKCKIEVLEAHNGQILEPNKVYVAPGGKQMKIGIIVGDKTKIIRITDDPPENYCKPSVDYLFRSVAQIYGNRALAIIMTGMGSDGVIGLKSMKEKGAKVIAQDEQSCVIFGMPKQAIDANVVDAIVPLDKITGQIIKYVTGFDEI